MNIRRWEPLDELLCLRESMEHPFTGYLPHTTGRVLRPAPWRPAVEVHEENGRVVLFAALPGVNPKSLEVTVSGDIVTLKAVKGTSGSAGTGFYDSRVIYGSYPLPSPVQAGLATATFRNGILEVRIPRAGEPEARTVKVEVAA
ncbi:MAG TPA: Hsp20/alpha crystallin family protein [bacterium]|jgi:HSP20 family protein|nr:Hsp20/alpha crystallin family protein [bacterium]